VIAATLADALEIFGAIRLIGVGQQAGLQPVLLRGERRIDRCRRPFVRSSKAARPTATSRSLDERERLSRFLKIGKRDRVWDPGASIRTRAARPDHRVGADTLPDPW
jgi:hypothetical protein